MFRFFIIIQEIFYYYFLNFILNLVDLLTSNLKKTFEESFGEKYFYIYSAEPIVKLRRGPPLIHPAKIIFTAQEVNV